MTLNDTTGTQCTSASITGCLAFDVTDCLPAHSVHSMSLTSIFTPPFTEREEQDRLDRERETSWLSAPAPSARNFKALLNEDEEDEENIFSPVSEPRRDTSSDLQRNPSVNLEEMLAAEKLALEAEERDRAELILKLSPLKPACGEAAMPPEEEVAPMPKDIKMISPCEKTSFVIQTIVPEKQGLLLVNYNGQTHAVDDSQSKSWLTRWVCVDSGFVYIFVRQENTSAEDIVLCSDRFATVETHWSISHDHAGFAVQNKHRSDRKVSFRTIAPEDERSMHCNEDEDSLAAAWGRSVAESESVVLDAHRFMNAVLPTWVLEADVNSCFGCEVELTWHRWGYHCRLCGNLFCRKCCNRKKQLPRHWMPGDPDKTVKCCNTCVNVLENCLAFGATAQPRTSGLG